MQPIKAVVSVTLIAAGACAAAAHAKEVPVDVQVCFGGTAQVMTPAQGTVMGTWRVTGTAQSAQVLTGSARSVGTYTVP